MASWSGRRSACQDTTVPVPAAASGLSVSVVTVSVMAGPYVWNGRSCTTTLGKPNVVRYGPAMTSADLTTPDAVRSAVRAFLDENFDRDSPLRTWLERLADSGWGTPQWPTEWFGKGLSTPLAAAAFDEFRKVKAPGPPAGLGRMLAAPTIIAHASDEVKKRYVRAILVGDDAWCQLFSEPGAGSDLASLQTRAELDGDEYVVNGQKVWTSGARGADLGMLLARTDVDVPKHRGITYFAFEMDQPGVEVRRRAQPRCLARQADGVARDAPVARDRDDDRCRRRDAGRLRRSDGRRRGAAGAVRAGTVDLRRLRPGATQHHRRAGAGSAQG